MNPFHHIARGLRCIMNQMQVAQEGYASLPPQFTEAQHRTAQAAALVQQVASECEHAELRRVLAWYYGHPLTDEQFAIHLQDSSVVASHHARVAAAFKDCNGGPRDRDILSTHHLVIPPSFPK